MPFGFRTPAGSVLAGFFMARALFIRASCLWTAYRMSCAKSCFGSRETWLGFLGMLQKAVREASRISVVTASTNLLTASMGERVGEEVTGPATTGRNVQGPFIHQPGDDDTELSFGASRD